MNLKKSIFQLKKSIFEKMILDFWIFFSKIFPFFFDRSQKIYFSELKKKVEYSFDVKNYDLSISEVFSAIAALLDGFWSCFLSKL